MKKTLRESLEPKRLPELSEKPDPAQYKSLNGKYASLGGVRVKVGVRRSEGRQGSWERGFKFTSSERGYLTRDETPDEVKKRKKNPGVVHAERALKTRKTMTPDERAWHQEMIDDHNRPRPMYSYNHGQSWHADPKEARKAKGKVPVLNKSKHSELAFDGIQKINRDYDPNYKWRP